MEVLFNPDPLGPLAYPRPDFLNDALMMNEEEVIIVFTWR